MLVCHKDEVSKEFLDDQDWSQNFRDWSKKNMAVEISEDDLKDGSRTMEEIMKLKTTRERTKADEEAELKKA